LSTSGSVRKWAGSGSFGCNATIRVVITSMPVSIELYAGVVGMFGA